MATRTVLHRALSVKSRDTIHQPTTWRGRHKYRVYIITRAVVIPSPPPVSPLVLAMQWMEDDQETRERDRTTRGMGSQCHCPVMDMGGGMFIKYCRVSLWQSVQEVKRSESVGPGQEQWEIVGSVLSHHATQREIHELSWRRRCYYYYYGCIWEWD